MSSPDSTTPRKSSDSSSPRRSSQSGMFGNLHSYKRDGAAYEARRQSITEQSSAKPGFFGTMWHNVVKGPSTSTTNPGQK